MPPHDDDDLSVDEPPTIEPYTVLSLSKDATADQIKSAYRKAALKHHPDKAPANLKDEAKIKFQEVAFAYAVLSDPVRRKRYDATGSTAESVDFEDFSWAEFYQDQFRDVITSEAIEKFSNEYKGSIEEKDAVLGAFRKSKGKWRAIYESVMLSNPLEDEDRFRAIIDEAILKKEVEAYKAYTEETARGKAVRMKAAKREESEAMAYAAELGVEEKLFGKAGGKKKDNGEDGLAALIRKNQAGRESFFDQLEAKYAGEAKKPKGKKGKKRTSADEDDEDDGMPSEEAFQKAAGKLKGRKATAGDDATGGRKSKRAKR